MECLSVYPGHCGVLQWNGKHMAATWQPETAWSPQWAETRMDDGCNAIGTTWNDMERRGTTWNDMERHGTPWSDQKNNADGKLLQTEGSPWPGCSKVSSLTPFSKAVWSDRSTNLSLFCTLWTLVAMLHSELRKSKAKKTTTFSVHQKQLHLLHIYCI